MAWLEAFLVWITPGLCIVGCVGIAFVLVIDIFCIVGLIWIIVSEWITNKINRRKRG